MLPNKGKTSLKQSVTYSVLLHIAVFACGSISFFLPKKDNLLFVDVEIAGEGELRQVLSSYEEPPKQEEPPKEVVEETKPEEEVSKGIKEEKLPEKVEEIPEDKRMYSGEKTEPTQAEDDQPKVTEVVEEEKREEEIQEDVQEEAVPKVEEKKPEPKPQPVVKEKKKKIKKKRKALMEVIKKAEKQKKKKMSVKKLHDIIDKNSKKKDDAFDKMLSGSMNDLKKVSGKGSQGKGAGSFGSGHSLAEGDYEMISSQIYPHWVVPGGVRDAENIVIEIRVQLRDTGEVIPSSVKILDEKRYAADYIFRAAADSARRAVLEASPLKIPREKLELFRDFTLRFNLKEALGG